MPPCVAIIAISSVTAFGLVFLAVAFVDSRADRAGDLVKYLRRKEAQKRSYWREKLWKPVAGGLCAALLVGGAAAEFTISDVRTFGEKRPVLFSTLVGAALAVITVLVIEALVRSVASKSWQGSLRNAWTSAVRGGRRGAEELGQYLDQRAIATLAPKNARSREAQREAHELWADLGGRVSQASLAAFASDQARLGESMHQLSMTADTLQQALKRYAAGERSKTSRT